ncbi:MAG: A24 family peptidase [Nanoarchaeota archaeon]
MDLFVYLIALIWIVLALIQDLKTREIWNWVNFSLLVVGLTYKSLIAISEKSLETFIFTILGVCMMIIFANLLYYTRTFAGGDAKLLIALASVLPYYSWIDSLAVPLLFVFGLFFVGALYSLVYSTFIVAKNRKGFSKEFRKNFRKNKVWMVVGAILGILLIFVIRENYGIIFGLLFVLFPWIYVYLRAVEEGCMIVSVKPGELGEGEWLYRSVKIGRRVIRNGVHGLSKEEIKIIRRGGKNVLIRQGIPFTPAFLIIWVIMVYVYLVLEIHISEFFALF